MFVTANSTSVTQVLIIQEGGTNQIPIRETCSLRLYHIPVMMTRLYIVSGHEASNAIHLPGGHGRLHAAEKYSQSNNRGVVVDGTIATDDYSPEEHCGYQHSAERLSR